MIVSFHPLFEADNNIICAGRPPNENDLTAIKAADAVILPQGCYPSLYAMTRANCRNLFPNYDARFKYPGKIGQIKLFRELNVPHPATEIHADVASFRRRCQNGSKRRVFDFPMVFKLDWGGEGDTVFLINSSESLEKILEKSIEFEKTGQAGFLLQAYVPSQNRTLRVVVIGRRVIAYWKVQNNTGGFYANISKGAAIDADADPELQHAGVALVKNLCQKTGINLAGFDVIFSSENDKPVPMMLEINYFFGRKGLGGSEAFYRILQEEIKAWLDGLNIVE